MAVITVHAGKGFLKGRGQLFLGTLTLPSDRGVSSGSEQVELKWLTGVQMATEDKVKKMAGAVGWGAVGALALGPLGLLAGVLAGGNKKEVTFVAQFRDGREILASTDSKTFIKLQAAAF